MREIILLRIDAPEKPAVGAACNGCGVCCAMEPCPIGQLFSGRRRGACSALSWSDTAQRYVCGLVSEPRRHLPPSLRWTSPVVSRLALRLIASGIGCDADAEAEVARDPSRFSNPTSAGKQTR